MEVEHVEDAAAVGAVVMATTSPSSPSSSSDAGTRAATTTSVSTSSSSFKRRVSAPASPPKRKSRKSTHTLRKEEKQQLLREMARLQAQMDKLKRRALGGGGAGDDRQTAAQKSFAADVLQDALQQQLARFADAQVLFSAIGMTQVVSPIAMPVRLGVVRSERVATLAAMKDARLRVSRAFLARRCGALDPRQPFTEDQRFEVPNGDYCVVRCSNLQLEGAASVRQVFDTLQYYYRHIEISMTERLGTVTIREDDDVQDEYVYQNRLVGVAATGNLLVETNTVHFSEFVECDGGAYGLIATDFVDDDALYPYQPSQRLRKDTSLILQMTSLPREAEAPLVVVLTRWSYTRLHRARFPIPSSAVHEVREGMARWCETMMQSLRDSLLAGK